MRIFHSKPMKKNILLGIKTKGCSDIALTYHHQQETITVLNHSELLTQLKVWKQEKNEVRKSNVRQYDLEGTSVYLFVVQPSDEKKLDRMGICPFSMSLGLMVTGVGYICFTRDTLDLVIRYIGVEGATKNPLFEKN